MSERLNVIAFVRSEEAGAALRQICSGLSGAKIDIKVAKLQDVMRRHVNGHDAVLLDFNPRDAAETDRLQHIVRNELPNVPVLVSANAATLEDVRRIMNLGVVDVLPLPLRQTDLAVALDHAARRQAQRRSPADSNGKVITFLKGGGGAGASTVAVQGGCILASEGKQKSRTCLLDLDVQFGTAGLYLDLKNEVGVFNLLEAPERLDQSLLSGAMTTHACGLDVLLSPQQMVALDAVTPEFIGACLRVAREHYDYVLVDISPAWTNWTHATLRDSDMIVLVTQLTVAGLRQTLRQIEAIQSNGLADVPLRLVVNRHNARWLSAKSTQLNDAEKTLGRKFDFVLPNDYPLVKEAIDQGVPISKIARKSSLEKAIRQMYRDLSAELAAAPRSQKAHIVV